MAKSETCKPLDSILTSQGYQAAMTCTWVWARVMEHVVQPKLDDYYGDESERDIEKRFNDDTQWQEADGDDDNLSCLSGGDCWFQGNLDRRREYSAYKLIGHEDEYTICHVCFSNHRSFSRH